MRKLNSILLIDDDDITNTLHRLLLKKMNIVHEVLAALNGKRAIDLLIERDKNNLDCPDLIFLDINMPVMNGFEFLKAYERVDIPNKASVITIMLTTSVHSQDTEDAKHPYIKRFLNKPLTSQKVNDILNDHFDWQFPG